MAALALVGSTLPAGATHTPDQSFKMSEIFTSPNGKTNSDFAFWGDYAFLGYYTGDAAPSGGVRIFDISNPAAPRLVKDLQCDGLQADPIARDSITEWYGPHAVAAQAFMVHRIARALADGLSLPL